MKVYMVQNGDNLVMAVCLSKRKANAIAVNIGQARWHEAWKVTPLEVDKCDPDMLGGSESYRKMMRILENRKP